jgi:hypothetical protein
MISGKRVKAGFDIAEVLLEKDGHIRVGASAVGHGRMGVRRGRAFLPIVAVPDGQAMARLDDAGVHRAHRNLTGMIHPAAATPTTRPASPAPNVVRPLSYSRTVSATHF